MRVVVYNDEGTAIAGRTDNTPLRSTAVDRPSSVLLLDSCHDITRRQVAFFQAVNRMLCPEEADEALRRATRSD